MDFCYGSPCVNGECVNLQDGYQCNCEEGRRGRICKNRMKILYFVFCTTLLLRDLFVVLTAPLRIMLPYFEGGVGGGDGLTKNW